MPLSQAGGGVIINISSQLGFCGAGRGVYATAKAGLASPLAGYVVGHTLIADGGYVLD